MQNSIDTLYIQELQRGSHKAFSYLFDTYSDMLYGFVLLHTKSAVASEDIVQEVFIKVWDNKKEIKTEGSFKSYLFTIAKNKIIDSFRMQINKVDFDNFIDYCDSEDLSCNNVEHNLFYEDFVRKLNDAKLLLTKQQCVIFELSREKGFSNKEIAEQLAITEQTVKNQLSTSLKTLRTKLQEYTVVYALFL